MRTETYTRNIYEYDELSEKAKEHVKEMFSERQGEDSDIFTETCEDRLNVEFPHSDLKVQYSLGYSQGDGFNIYGSLQLDDMFPHLAFLALSDSDKELLKWAFYEYGSDYNMPYNNHHCYCICDDHDYVEDVVDNVEYDEDVVKEDIKQFGYTLEDLYSILDKFNKGTQYVLSKMCKEFEEYGYDFFYHEFTDEEAEDFAEANGLEFYEDGTLV